MSVRPDEKDKRRYILVLDQSGLGLPDRDDYFRDDARTIGLRKAYEAYRHRFAQLSDGDTSRRDGRLGVAFETDLARVSLTRVERRDPKVVYNLYTVDSLTKFAPGFDWAAYLSSMGVAAHRGGQCHIDQVCATGWRVQQRMRRLLSGAPICVSMCWTRPRKRCLRSMSTRTSTIAAARFAGWKRSRQRAEQVIVRITRQLWIGAAG